jgi:hypothetical protein
MPKKIDDVTELPSELKGVKHGAWQSVVRAVQANFDHLMGILRALGKAHNTLADDFQALEDWVETTLSGTPDADHAHDGSPDSGGAISHGSLSGVTADQHHAQQHTLGGADHTGNLPQSRTHDSADTDSSPTAIHHTLGTGANQAAPGTHSHPHNILSTAHPDTDADDTPASGEVLTWDGTKWVAAPVSGGGGGSVSVEEDDVEKVATASVLDFGHGLDVTESPAGEANISVDEAELSHNALGGVGPDDHHARDHQARHQTGGADALTGTLDANARVAVRKNAGAVVGTRRRLNLVEGSGIAITAADDPTDEEVDITIAAVGGGGEGVTSATIVWNSKIQIAAGQVSRRIYLPWDCVIDNVYVSVPVAPTGTFIVDVRKNGTTIFPTSPKPRVTAGNLVGDNYAPDITSALEKDYLTVHIQQLGGVTTGRVLVYIEVHHTALGFELNQSETHGNPDTDAGPTSLHHTLGTGSGQAAPGNHGHAHSSLTGIGADDHHARVHTLGGSDHTGNLAQSRTHNNPDTDSSPTALHHTLGTGANQAAAGNHAHTMTKRVHYTLRDLGPGSTTLSTIGTEPNITEVLVFNDGAANYAYGSIMVPSDWAGGALTLVLYITMQNASGGDVRLRVNKLPFTGTELPGDTGTDITVTRTPAATSAVQEVTIGIGTPTAANQLWRLVIGRLGAAAADTYAANMRLVAWAVEYSATT